MNSRALAHARRSGLVEADRPLLVMLSGGPDSTCLLDVAQRLGANLRALHVNYGLRPEAGADEAFCHELCDRLGVELLVERIQLEPLGGNLQARARDARYEAAERHAIADYATAHTASDQAETVLYRLVSSPGRTALLGMPARRGRLVRPLLEADRRDTVEHCRLAGLGWREDSSNADPRFARARVRHEVLPVLAQIAPRAERTIALSSRWLREEAGVLDDVVDGALAELGPAPAISDLRSLPAGLARLVLRRLAGGAPLTPDDLDAVLGIGAGGGTASIELGDGLRAVVEYGRVRFTRTPAGPPPPPAKLGIPGRACFGEWRIEAVLGGAGDVVLSAAALGDEVVVRSWRAGDRMRPAGVGGSKKLQDLFTDRKLPRESRAGVPVVEARGEIAWVVGLAVGERFQSAGGAGAVALSAMRVDGAASIGTGP
ncbi:MAG: tRNA lysidine(34) synthetase TilS [Thermoleophilaceae bacterium]